MAESFAKKITMTQAKQTFGNVAFNNHYIVNFSSLKPTIIRYLERSTGFSDIDEFISRTSGLLCSDASLPASAFATAEVKDNFMGIPQEFAHTRLYTDIDFTFYVDNNYTMLRFFEGWMDYISSGSERQGVTDRVKPYYRRMKYPDDYKVDTMSITKFERNYDREIQYQFMNAFPKSVTPIPVTYGEAELLKVSVSFNYDRYIMKRINEPEYNSLFDALFGSISNIF